MSKSTTPMAKFSQQFKDIEKILKNNVDEMSSVALNKVDPKYKWYSAHSTSYQTKGVKSDFIRIFSVNKQYSFAFSFNEIDAEEKCYIMITLKKEGSKSIKSSKQSVMELKSSIREFVSKLKTLEEAGSCNERSIKKIFKAVFLGKNTYDENKESDHLVEKLTKWLKRVENSVSFKSLSEEEEEIKNQIKLIEDKVSKAHIRHKTEKLKKEYHEALKKVDDYETMINEKDGLRDLETKLRKLGNKKRTKRNKIEEALVDDLRKLPRHLRENLLTEVKKQSKIFK